MSAVIYEVNAMVPVADRQGFAEMVAHHRVKLLSQPGFEKVEYFVRHAADEGEAEDGFLRWTIQYHVQDRESVDRYIQGPGKVLRQEAQVLFAGRVKVGRRILERVPSLI